MKVYHFTSVINSTALLFVSFLLFGGCSSQKQAKSNVKKPNVIVILVDDMGFSDIGCYGSEIPTPNLDALAANGLRFTQFYNAARCCPTRASLLTGLYPHQTGIGHMTEDLRHPGYKGYLNESCVTIAEVLKEEGYVTAMSGKWHIGQNKGVTPWNRGFTHSLNAAAGGFYLHDDPKAKLFLNGEAINKASLMNGKWYSSDLWVNYGLQAIDQAKEQKKPFYLHLCFNAPHFPLQASQKDIDFFLGKYQAGWDAIRETRFAKMKKLGIIANGINKSARPDAIQAWDAVPRKQQARFDSLMAVYAATVYAMDRAVGDLVSGLKARGELDNTLIVFMSDNGGNAESGPSGRTKGNPTEANSSWFCGESWAYAQNTPFREYKHYIHEGGIATPLIVHWPNGVLSKNELRDHPTHLIDIMPTIVEVTGATYPTTYNGKAIQPMSGKSLIPAFGNKAIDRQALYWEHEGNAAIRAGNMKLVRKGITGAWELYDLSNDRSELNDLAAKQPNKVSTLVNQWTDWATQNQVLPYPDGFMKNKQTED